MAKPVKILLSIIAAIVILIVIAIITLPLFIDPNDFKPEIAAAVKDKTGRDLTMTGELKLSIFPWLGISTGKMALGNAAGFQDKPFATLEDRCCRFIRTRCQKPHDDIYSYSDTRSLCHCSSFFNQE